MRPVPELDLGGVRVRVLTDGELRVDGGAMFGTVPRSRWARLRPPDAANKVPLALNCFLVETAGRRVLVDTGMGEALPARHLRAYGLRREETLPAALGRLGIAPGDVDVVVSSHLHFDHCGGHTVRGASGALVPAFPGARYVVQRGEWEDARHPVGRDKPSYVPALLEPLEAAGVLELLDGDAPVVPGVEAVVLPGHTRRHQGVKVTGAAGTLLIAADALPTSAHVALDAIMGFDLYPVESFETARRLEAEAAAGEWHVGFGHDPDRPLGRIVAGPGRRGGRRLRVESPAAGADEA